MAKQATLFGTKIALEDVPSHHRVKAGGKTKKQLYKEGREARDTLNEKMMPIVHRIVDSSTPEHFATIIADLNALKTTPAYQTLAECRDRNVSDWIIEGTHRIDFYIWRAEIGIQAKNLFYVKHKAETGEWSNTNRRQYYFTCCGQRVAGLMWVVESNFGEVLCKKCFVEQHSEKRFHDLSEKTLVLPATYAVLM